MIPSRLAALVALAAALCIAGCSSKMDDKECAKLRGEAFDLLNKGQQCNNDQDCRQSDWPGCAKPVSIANWDKIKPMADGYKKGQCEEPKHGVQGAAALVLQAGPLRAPREGHRRGRGRDARRSNRDQVVVAAR